MSIVHVKMEQRISEIEQKLGGELRSGKEQVPGLKDDINDLQRRVSVLHDKAAMVWSD